MGRKHRSDHRQHQIHGRKKKQLSLITYNVENVWWYNGTPGDRDNAVASKLLAQAPDFICLQEFDPLYRTPSDGSDGLITLISEQYTEVSIDGMEDRKDEIYNPIFFNSKDYTQVASGYVWFMDVIDVVDDAGNPLSALTKEYNYPGYPKDYTGVKEVGSTYGRCLVWAVLEDADGDRFLIANVHFSQEDDVAQRAAIHALEAKFVADKVKGIADGYEDITVLVGGDMNSVISNENCGVDTMLDNGFTHTYNLASAKNNLESYHGETAPSTGYLEYAIDHILTLNADLNVRSFYVLNDAALYSVSDHLPVKMSFYK